MKAVRLEKRGGSAGLRVVISDLPKPVAARGEMVVEMRACGLCGTDLEKMRGEYIASMPVVGHEAVGVVTEVGGGVRRYEVGDRVFPHHHVPCHECYYCRSGSETMCAKYRTSNLDPGGFSEFIRVPEWNVAKGGVLKLDEGLSFETASLIEPLGCCVRALRATGVKKGESVLVVGAGPVGLMHLMLLRGAGAKVVASDISRPRLEFARNYGAEAAVNPKEEDVSDVVRDRTGGIGADLAVVASGSKAAIIQALRSVRKGGTVCLFGVPAKGSVLDYDISDLYNSEQRILTSYAATDADTKEAMKILSKREGEFRKIVTDSFHLPDFEAAVEAASGGEAMKVVVTP